MRSGRLIIALVGLAFAIALIIRYGAGAVAQASLSIGWGLAAIIAFELVPLALKTIAWRALLSSEHTVSLHTVLLARWIRQSVSQLLPVAQVGGDVVGARVLSLRGIPGDIAGASTIVDLTFGAISQILITMIGLAALVMFHGNSGLVWPTLAGTGAITIAIVGFVIVQRNGLFGFLALRAGALSSALTRLVGEASQLDAGVARLYQRPHILAGNLLWQFIAQLAASGEILLVCYFLGHPISLADALILQSLIRGMRAAAFFVPGGLGVQEGGALLVAGLIGLSPEIGLAIALIKRVRELVVGIPGLIAWHLIEVGRQVRRG